MVLSPQSLFFPPGVAMKGGGISSLFIDFQPKSYLSRFHARGYRKGAHR